MFFDALERKQNCNVGHGLKQFENYLFAFQALQRKQRCKLISSAFELHALEQSKFRNTGH